MNFDDVNYLSQCHDSNNARFPKCKFFESHALTKKFIFDLPYVILEDSRMAEYVFVEYLVLEVV